ncbi:MAG: flagellin [Opitutae bacterium]|nr:flagellin [Opitutae bacterium]
MSVVINTNGIAARTGQMLHYNYGKLRNSLARFSSGERIVNVQDDSAGLSVAKKINSAVVRNKRVQEISQNAVSFLEVQKGALQEVQNTLDRMSELKAMSIDQTQSASDLNNYNTEFYQLQKHLSVIRDMKFNSTSLFVTEGSDIQMLSTEVGEQGDIQIDRVTVSGTSGDLVLNVDGSNFNFSMGSATALQTAINASNLGDIMEAKNANDGTGTFELEAKKYNNRYSLNTSYSVTDASSSVSNTTIQKSSIVHVNMSREGVFRTDTNGEGLLTTSGASLLDITKGLSSFAVSDFISFTQNTSTAQADNGAEMARLSASSNILESNFGNLQQAVSRLNDVDLATETTTMAKYQILYQSATAMLSQANANPNVAMTLIG